MDYFHELFIPSPQIKGFLLNVLVAVKFFWYTAVMGNHGKAWKAREPPYIYK